MSEDKKRNSINSRSDPGISILVYRCSYNDDNDVEDWVASFKSDSLWRDEGPNSVLVSGVALLVIGFSRGWSGFAMGSWCAFYKL